MRRYNRFHALMYSCDRQANRQPLTSYRLLCFDISSTDRGAPGKATGHSRMEVGMDETLYRGSHGAKVKYLQELLNLSLTSHRLQVDGVFGPETETAVRLFQARLGVGIDGIAGPITWVMLKRGAVRHHPTQTGIKENYPDAPWMTVATREIGQAEIRGPMHNPRILEYHAATNLHASTDETSWCSSFVNWCLQEVGIGGTRSAAAASWMHWGIPIHPKPGAITVMHSVSSVCSGMSSTGYHVAFFLQDSGSHISLFGGNQKNRVKHSTYPKKTWRVMAYRWPDN